MKNTKICQHARVVQRSVQIFEGGLIIFLICLQITFSFDSSIFIYCIALNQIQFAFSGWCPITALFNNMKWFRNN